MCKELKCVKKKQVWKGTKMNAKGRTLGDIMLELFVIPKEIYRKQNIL